MAFDDATQEQSFLQARQLLAQHRPERGNSLVLIGSLALFTLAQLGGGSSLTNLIILVVVLFIHEGGHWLGMRLFGYRDVRVFFVPLFGAATSGRKGGVAAWKEAVVLLLGPLPGIALGIACLVDAFTQGRPLLRDAGVMLISINGFNLLPLGGLDGGQLIRRLLFSRQRHLEVAFLTLAGLGLAWVSLEMQLWVLLFVAVLGLITVPFRSRVLRAANALRMEARNVTADVAELDEETLRALFVLATSALTPNDRGKPLPVVRTMEAIADAARLPPRAGATVLLLLAWLTGVFVTLVALVSIAGINTRHWHTHTDEAGRFSVELPAQPHTLVVQEQTARGRLPYHVVWTQRELVKRFTVSWLELPQPLAPNEIAPWIDARRDAFARALEAKVTRDAILPSPSGEVTRELALDNGHRQWRARIVIAGTREYDVFASAPELDGGALRVLDSFRRLR